MATKQATLVKKPATARKRATSQPLPEPAVESVAKKTALLFYAFLAILAAYAAVSLFGPVDPAALAKYNLSEARIHVLLLTIVIPFSIIWLVAFYGYSSFRNYAHVIKDTKEGNAFSEIARGLGFLAFSLPLNSLLSALLTPLLINHPSLLIPSTILRNYIALILPLLAFIYTSRGAEKLASFTKRQRTPARAHLWMLGSIIGSSLFTWLMIARPADERTAKNIYFLPGWLIVLTLTVPYLHTWYRGILTVYHISSYQYNVKGRLYRESLHSLSIGIFVVIFVNILVQLIITVSERLYRLQLTPLLALIYLLIALYAVGFGLIANGAKKMKKIEEV